MPKISLKNISFQLLEPHSFDWLEGLGEVFAVFDQQDSGNLSFGIYSSGGKRFVKYAGAKTIGYKGEPEEAVNRLKLATDVYKELAHPHLIKLLGGFSVPAAGYAAIFDWFEGENIYPHSSLTGAYNHPNAPCYRFRELPVGQRLKALDDIFVFHLHAARQEYVAVDFYDGSILYDFTTGMTRLCDIDLYHKHPLVNEMGRMWGSSRFMSPEEFQQGAPIDEVTNVYNMGATAFVLVGGGLDRSLDSWEAGEALYEVAAKAVRPDRGSRYASLADFYAAWSSAALLQAGISLTEGQC